MPEEQADAAAETPSPAPEETNKHTRRQRSRKAKTETVSEETPPATDVSDQARERRACHQKSTDLSRRGRGHRYVFEDEIAAGETARRVRLEFDLKPSDEKNAHPQARRLSMESRPRSLDDECDSEGPRIGEESPQSPLRASRNRRGAGRHAVSCPVLIPPRR